MIGILSDAHGNEEAFEQGLAILYANGAKKIIFLGDSIGYIPSRAVLDRLKALSETGDVCCIMGNHEEMLLQTVPPPNDLIYQIAKVKAQLSEDDLSFVASWPESILREYTAGTALFIHGSPADPIGGYLYPDSDFSVSCEGIPCSFIFCGNTHRPFIEVYGNITIVNVGSCGLPRDVGKLGAVALFDEIRGNVKILRFSIDSAVNNILESGVVLDESVIKLFGRESQHYVGEYVGE